MTNGQEQLSILQREIADRLRPVCGGISEASFDELVRQIAAVKLKYGEESDASASVRNRVSVSPGQASNSGRVVVQGAS